MTLAATTDLAVLWEANLHGLLYFRPEMTLAVTAAVILLADLWIGNDRPVRYYFPAFVSVLGIAVAGFYFLAPIYGTPEREVFHGMAVVDPFGFFFRVLSLAVTAVVVVMAAKSKDTDQENVPEFNALLLILCMGMMLLASANDMIMLYLALETVSITSYILVGYTRGSKRSAEAAVKYLLYGAVASGTMLFGLSILYGLAGSTDIHTVADRVLNASGGRATAAAIAALFTFAGFGYKIASAPFHMWAPDVYEGAPTPVTAFLTVGTKAAGFAALVRFFMVVLAKKTADPGVWEAVGLVDWPLAIAILAGVTMTIGNLAAIPQTNVKRLLGYSSIAHAGYMMMGLVVLTQTGLNALLFYVVVYYFMNLGAFLVVTVVSNQLHSEDISAYKGLGWRAPFAAASMAIFLFSLVGLPPLAGFIGKYHLFAALITKGMSQPEAVNWYYMLAICAAVNSVISLFYYARVIKAMYLDRSEDTSKVTMSPMQGFLMGLLVLPTVALGIWWGSLMDYVKHSAQILAASF